MESRDFDREAVCCEWDYYNLCESTRALVTFHQYLSMENCRWSADEVKFWGNQTKEFRASAASWRETQSNPTPNRSTQLIARCLGNQIISVGVRSMLWRYAMTVMMRHVRME
jgi:hypothetical protein